MNLIDLSKRYLLNETEHRVLSCILSEIENGNTKINIRVEKNGDKIHIDKLAKKLGYQGYSDMIYSLKRRVEEERNTSAGIDLSSILKDVDLPVIDAFAKELFNQRNNCIYIVGLGFSTIASSYLMRRLATLNILAYDGSPVDIMRRSSTPGMTIILCKGG